MPKSFMIYGIALLVMAEEIVLLRTNTMAVSAMKSFLIFDSQCQLLCVARGISACRLTSPQLYGFSGSSSLKQTTSGPDLEDGETESVRIPFRISPPAYFSYELLATCQ